MLLLDVLYKTLVKIHESIFLKKRCSNLDCAAAVSVISSVIKKKKASKKEEERKQITVWVKL